MSNDASMIVEFRSLHSSPEVKGFRAIYKFVTGKQPFNIFRILYIVVTIFNTYKAIFFGFEETQILSMSVNLHYGT